MPEWETKPYEQFPQTPEIYLEQIIQELEALERKKEYLLLEKERMENESS